MSLESLRKKLAEKKVIGTVVTHNNIVNKFQKRSESILEKTYQNREKQSESKNLGLSIFDQELLSKFEISEFTATTGDHFFEILPISFDPNIPYYREVCVHFSVGTNNDAFICMAREMHGQSCYRCQQQRIIWNSLDEKESVAQKDVLKKYYPTDRAIYLLYFRTKELINQEPPVYDIIIWNAPKKKVHAEIQGKARNKLKRTNLDISDVTPGGDGRTVAFEVEKQGDWPNYKGFELHDRDIPIPEQILEELDALITYATNNGFTNAIDALLVFPNQTDIQKSMETEPYNTKNTEVDNAINKDITQTVAPLTKFSTAEKQKQQSISKISKEEVENIELELTKAIEEIEKDLNTMNLIQFKQYLNGEPDFQKYSHLPKSEAIELIIGEIFENELGDHYLKYNEYY